MVKTQVATMPIAVAALFLCTGRPAGAHHGPALPVGRYLSANLHDNRLALSLQLLYADLPAEERRREIDVDGDRTLTDAELLAERTHLRAAAKELVAVAVDETRIELDAVATIDLGGERGATAAPLVIELGASVPIEPGRRVIRIEAGREPPGLGETEIALAVGKHWRLVETTGRGGAARVRAGSVVFSGPRLHGAARQATFIVESRKGAPHLATEGWGPRLAAALVGVGFVAAAMVLKRRRRQPLRSRANDASM